MPEQMSLRELRLTDYNGNQVDLSGAAATLVLDDASSAPPHWKIIADTDQTAYFDPVASFYNAEMVTDDRPAFKGEVHLETLKAGESGRTASIVLGGNRELIAVNYPPSGDDQQSEQPGMSGRQ